MIHKFLIISKNHVMISSSKIEDESNSLYNVDLLMPLDIYWDVGKLINLADYLVAGEEHQADVHEIYKKIFRKAAPFAVFETDRLWLYQHSHHQSSGAA